LCAGNNVILDAQNAGMSYLWQDASVNQTFSVGQSGQYFVTVTDGLCSSSDTINVIYIVAPIVDLGNDTIICGTFSLTLDASAAIGNYLWQDGSNLSTLNVNVAGLYWVEVDNGFCTTTDSIIVLNPQPPIVNLGNDTTFCAVNSLLLDVQNVGATYLWQDGSVNQTLSASISGLYYVEVNLGGCFATDTINVTVLPTPVVDLGNDTTICSAQLIVLDATAAGVTYLWQDGSANSSYDVSSSGTYSVVLDNGFCTATDTVDIVFSSSANIDLGNDTVICSNGIIVFDVLTPNATYNWSTSSTSPSIDVAQGGTYWVIVDVNGCISSDTVVVSTVLPPVVYQANVEFCIDESVTVILYNSPNLSYSWQDGSTQSTYVIDQPGTYEVTATNQCGTDATQFIADMKNCDCEIYVPNAFTPDDSEINQSFGAVTECPLEIFEFDVYNRWGQLVFHSNDINEFWDGTYLESDVQDGVYTWKIKYQFDDFPEKIITGHVTVIE
jgi:gliding motility-associated-like protein